MIKIIDNKEKLIDVKKICPGLVVNLGRERMKKEKKAYLRITVVRMICSAKKNLPPDMTFIINDAWRPQYVQKNIFANFVKRGAKKHPHWSKEKIIQEVEKYVAPFEGKYVSGHMTGGAVDIRLWKNNRKIPMRSPRLTYQENAMPLQPKLPKYIQKNRKIMFDALSQVGLTNCHNEYWHWSYGDIWWAKRKNKKTAPYGLVKKPTLS